MPLLPRVVPALSTLVWLKVECRAPALDVYEVREETRSPLGCAVCFGVAADSAGSSGSRARMARDGASRVSRAVESLS